MYQAGGLHPKDPLRQNPTSECEQCLKRQIATKVIKYQAQYNCQPDALELLARQHSQMKAFVYQNRIALDYLLAEEGGVCGKFNESECCIEIDDYGETIRDLAAEIKKVAHVPVQKWNSILQASWWDQLFGQETENTTNDLLARNEESDKLISHPPVPARIGVGGEVGDCSLWPWGQRGPGPLWVPTRNFREEGSCGPADYPGKDQNLLELRTKDVADYWCTVCIMACESLCSSSSFGRTATEVGVSPPTPKPRDPPLPSSDSEWDEPEPLPPGPKIPSQGPIASRTRKQTREVIQAPLRQAITSDGETKLIKVPFSSIDLEIWERIAKGYQSDPIGVAKKMKFMIKQHSPDWADLQLLLDALTETEKQLVLKVAGDLAEDDCRTTQEDVKDVFPLQDPGWDPNDDEELGWLKRYQELIVKGLERAIPKTINWSALYAIKQGPSQTPSEFLDHLRDAMHRHTTLDPGSDEGTQQLINLFLGQSTGDIRRKLQKIRGPNSQNLETLLDEA
ncbi:hypothetical protein DUI87_03454 [Hirundo rustica rustica]|uniref:Core shell protein Gag P30 domain-containing protein n=1 Tax=Hirundo rustica rustica TaxID=333673 RepID=A0A3M0L392_HIRRU|nr:hypothetical protein DUI87_03454 [Hirundo rustica rustica]